MPEFAINSAGTHYEHVVGFGGQNTKPSSNGTHVELIYSVKNEANSAESQGHVIYLSNERNIQFSCSYSLATQTLSTEVDVTGTDIEITRSGTGKLLFDIIGSPGVNLGARYSFSIVPKTPGAVFYTTKSCKVRTANGVYSYNLIHDDDEDECTDMITGFKLDSNAWSSSGNSTFSYNSFRFANPGARGSVAVESQVISCQIHLSMELDPDYNPAQCEACSRNNNCSDNGTCKMGSHEWFMQFLPCWIQWRRN